MDVEIAEHSGFCFGVRNTIKKIEATLASGDHVVYSIGLPVHNAQLTNKLKEQGLRIVDSIDEINDGCIIVRAHGLPPCDIEELKKRGIVIIDATCPFVKKAQDIATELTNSGYVVIVCGERNHPEVKALEGCLLNKHHVCTSINDLRDISLSGKMALISQTTQSPSIFREVAQELARCELRELRIFNTICESVEKRKGFTINLAERVDVMFVVGGKMSSNTKRLFEAASACNPHTYHIETADEIQDKWLKNATLVGISAGASTPDWIVQEVASHLTTL
ncbi:MAG: 4-hydroxy-3-methylbut-2-enyl diphosphate reductase [Candidatus Omnitrophica bacterium]|nr:4-hydroxy-3-methylbut-2-enyl diphosphate reductase [Candidatus Omnitrophota bacterium]